MAVSKSQLREAMDAHRQSLTSLKTAANAGEREREVQWVMRTGRELMDLLSQRMRATVPADMVRRAEAMVDESTQAVARVTVQGA